MLSLRKGKKGFTLIELMVVVAIIGVLALLGLRLYTGQQMKAKNAVVKANTGTIQTLIQAELADTTSALVWGMVDDDTATGLFAKSGIHVPDGGPQTANGTAAGVVGTVYVVGWDDVTDAKAIAATDISYFKINGNGFDDKDVFTTPLTARK